MSDEKKASKKKSLKGNKNGKGIKESKNGKGKTTHTPDPIARELILKKIIETNFIPSYIRKLAHPTDEQFLEDIEQDVFLILCSMSDEKLNEIYNGEIKNLRGYVSGIIHRQIKSTTSSYYRTYKRPLFKTKENPLSLAQQEVCGLFPNEWYEEVENTDFSNKIRI